MYSTSQHRVKEKFHSYFCETDLQNIIQTLILKFYNDDRNERDYMMTASLERMMQDESMEVERHYFIA